MMRRSLAISSFREFETAEVNSRKIYARVMGLQVFNARYPTDSVLKMESQRHLFLYALVVLSFVSSSASAVAVGPFEKPPTLPAHSLVPASLLSGNGFHVYREVPTDGLMAHFTIQSDVGTFQADSIEMLKIRVAEIPAIQQLTKTSKTQVFTQAIAENAVRPVQAAGQLVLHPVDTIQRIPAGVGRFFGRVSLGAQKIAQAATEPEGASAGEKAGETAQTVGKATRDVFGYEQERRELAKKLHVDPYTTNPILAKQLDDFALTAFRAHVGVTTTMSVFIPGSIAITATRVVSAWVWDTPKADLIVKNQNSLEEIGVPESKIKALTNNRTFPLSVQTEFVANLDRLSGVPGRVEAAEFASTAQSEVQARFLTAAVGMLARYHETRTPIARLLVGRAIIGQDRNGAIVAEAPVDYVSWVEEVSYFANRPDLKKSRRTLSLTGQFSPIAKRNFTDLGWAVNERVNPIPDSNGSF